MNTDDINRVIQENRLFHGMTPIGIIMDATHLQKFADLVAAEERERIIKANAPEIEKVNAYIKALEEKNT